MTLFRPFTPTLPRGIDPRALQMWRVSTVLEAAIVATVILGLDVLIWVLTTDDDVQALFPWDGGWNLLPFWAKGLLVGEGVLFGLWFIFSFFVAPPLRQARFRFDLREGELEVESGIWTMQRRLIPYARIQHVDLHQGPVARLYGLSEVIVVTAAGHTSIPALPTAEAERLRDWIAQKAGISDAS
ncbi:membrane protein YdbS with pleckstrin-like domain [Brockia lithotrophica]|uniref:Membrane protein YdbS with pleckstrin-like domain n=2 Tax=Brockia lithotrophica TaxID=933949 RepID=A0A660KUT5_9BACL|nr:membrane protein YdbS with pleckstrin-like domain [Brockia lithotrophica]